MTETKHTPEPWIASKLSEMFNESEILGPDGINILSDRYGPDGKVSHEDAARIVACVNACKGISNDVLEELNGELGKYLSEQGRSIYTLVKDMREAQQQRDELLAALEGLVNHTTMEFAEKWGFLPQRELASQVYDRVKFGASTKAKGETNQ